MTIISTSVLVAVLQMQPTVSYHVPLVPLTNPALQPFAVHTDPKQLGLPLLILLEGERWSQKPLDE